MTEASLAVAILSCLVAAIAVPRENWRLLLPPYGTGGAVEVAIAVIDHNGKIALVHRTPVKGQPLKWQFPSGAVKEGEDAKVVVRVEAKHETGLDVDVVAEIGRRRHPRSRKLCVYYACKARSDLLVNGDPAENIYARWVAASEVEAYIGQSMFQKVRAHLSAFGDA